MRAGFFLSLSIVVLTLIAAPAMAQTQVTFTRVVAPIFQERCQICHRPGTFAPMSLLTYEDARHWAKSIKEKVLMREMPLLRIYKNVGVRRFSNVISSSYAEMPVVVQWYDAG